VLTTGDLPLFEERYGQATAENVILSARQQLTQLYTFVFSELLAKMLAPSEKSSLEKCGSK